MPDLKFLTNYFISQWILRKSLGTASHLLVKWYCSVLWVRIHNSRTTKHKIQNQTVLQSCVWIDWGLFLSGYTSSLVTRLNFPLTTPAKSVRQQTAQEPSTVFWTVSDFRHTPSSHTGLPPLAFDTTTRHFAQKANKQANTHHLTKRVCGISLNKQEKGPFKGNTVLPYQKGTQNTPQSLQSKERKSSTQ